MKNLVFLLCLILAGLSVSPAYSQLELANPAAYTYIAALKVRINQVVNTSLALSEERPTAGSIKLRLCVDNAGALKKIEVTESSGKKEIDEITTGFIHRAFPFSPFPAGIKESELWLDLPIFLGKVKDFPVTNSPTTSSDEQPPIAFSKAQAASQLRLEGYIRIGLGNYQPTKIAKEQVELALLKIKETERNLYPTFSGEYKTSEGKTLTDPYEALSYGAEAEQLLLGLNQVFDSIKREKIGLQMANKNYLRLEHEVRYNVTKAYYELVGQEVLFKHWQDTSTDLRQDLELMQRLYKEGLAIAADFENVQSQQKLITHQISSVEYNIALAKLALAQAMNLDTPDLGLLEAPQEFGLEARDLKLDFNECVNKGLKYRPEIEIWQKTCESARIYETINRRENIPKVSVKGSYGRSGEAFSTQELELVDTWALTGKLTWLWGPNSLELSRTEDRTLPKNITDTVTKTEASTTDIKFSLLDKLNYYSALKEARITYQQSLNELNETKKKVVYEVKEAYLSYLRALSGMQTSLNRAGYKKNELKVIKARVDAGEASPTELAESKINLANEQASYLRSLGEYYTAVAALDKATAYQLRI